MCNIHLLLSNSVAVASVSLPQIRAGVCLYIMLAGCLPFDERAVGALLRKICSADYETPPWITTHAANLLGSLLTPDPRKR